MLLFSLKNFLFLGSFAGMGVRGGAGRLGSRAIISPSGCPSYYLIGARGTGEAQTTGSIAYNKLYQKVMAAIPGGAKEELTYSSSADYTITVSQGSQTEVRFMTDQLSKCPQTVFVLVGYSKGVSEAKSHAPLYNFDIGPDINFRNFRANSPEQAMVTTQTLINKSIPQDKIAAVALFGNPYFTPGLPQDKCGATTGVGSAAIAGLKIPDGLADRVYDCCVPGDSVCQTFGTIIAHLSYSGQPQEDATQFVIQKLKARIAVAN
ncbi:hypothetical protein MJO28_012055 [Puccinia striiformis f. sp. tritici]|uniref:Uncharacterized protein n=1 Tax=Puccinia striiformis f. sp. tritici TaxID=168172 RepID=A0ACC0E0S2_9BASI|nr:hypothetical protein Pst134EA_023100 [Puccinia striiformis f. sp. tritici]XP_047801851.1 hypothetical protein Pst134EA_023107 [Puccinia striiformis f. sp. tritici]KAH9446109.1 hypothetical protein Pst134EB_023927 [Puccinia striiformis f. sp. tritici]KAH9455641.1 hypothetical protein Pst134EA_023100 [Puccinia striiformis f. sp. tritici]KAH9455649.1 hypothetical protein Pst134EA_023107 [Puccinia striiformis f. sp. tritici]KAI7942028.1 hypothetical protein MJO28_012055 [Puccinia striiformis f.